MDAQIRKQSERNDSVVISEPDVKLNEVMVLHIYYA